MCRCCPLIPTLEVQRFTRRADQGTEVPKLGDNYNSHMGEVDISDKLVQYTIHVSSPVSEVVEAVFFPPPGSVNCER